MSGFNWAGFAAVLDGVRESRGLSWKEISEKTSVPMKTLNRAAAGKPVGIDTLAELRQWMGVGIDKFFANGSTK